MFEKYIKLARKDFFNIFFLEEDIDSKIRSVEKYLEKNKYEHNWDACEEGFIVKVSDKAEAIRIAGDFKLKEISYYEGLNKEILKTYSKKKPGRPKQSFFDKKTGKKMTKKDLQRKIKRDCRSKSQLIKNGIISKNKLEKAISEGEIKPVKMGNTSYINEGELKNYFKKHQQNGNN